MLVQLLPEQVASRWPMIQEQVEKSLPPIATGANVDSVYYSLLMERSQMWVLQDKDEVDKGFLITTSFLDISEIRTLLIYEAVILDKKMKIDWSKEYATLKTFAKAHNCSHIAAFVANKRVVEWLQSVGAETKFSYVCAEL